MSSRTTAQVAGAVAPTNNSDEVSPANKKTKLADLPAETLDIIAKLAAGDDFTPLINLASAESDVSRMLQKWKCSKCEGAIFLVDEDGDDDDKKLSIDDHANPFICGACGAKFCGNTDSGNYDCRRNAVCLGCAKVECRDCVLKHLDDCVACYRFGAGHCSECQGLCDTHCDLCGSSFCKHHGDHCDKCGVMTCGIHDYACGKCSYCKTSLCPGCHSHGDMMFNCDSSGKHSCNANSDGNKNCPAFSFERWPCCGVCGVCVEALTEEEGDY